MALLLFLRFLKGFVALREIGAGILPVSVEEE